MEQLIAESSGKENKGIIPVDVEPFVDVNHYSKDRLFVYLKNDGIFEQKINDLLLAGHQVITFDLNDPYELGAEFFRWEFAISIACGILQVNAFDQPDVQDNKNLTKQKIKEFLETGEFDFGIPALNNQEVQIFSSHENIEINEKTVKEIIDSFLNQKNVGDFVAINAYLPRLSKVENELQEFRKYVLQNTNLVTTLGFGPRFLHSTGQLHKGGPNSGLFIQIIEVPEIYIDVPDFGIAFDDLLMAQALGDYEALVNRDRRIIRIHLKSAKIHDLWN
jgi:transaldolase/glucose-6-phosphate isomerase